MSQDLIAVNGVFYEVAVGALKRTCDITDGDNAGRTDPPAASMIRDVIGTFFTYVLTIEPKQGKQAQYDAFHNALVQPVDSVQLTVPYGQTSKTFDAYITKVEDELKVRRGSLKIWGGMAITFTATDPNITPT